MAAKLTRVTHKIAIQLHLVVEGSSFAVLAPGGQSGNLRIHRHSWYIYMCHILNAAVF
jgi:hypothetical protein